jgi:hypothetical protein
MEPLFEAKATYNEQLTLFNVFRLAANKYKVERKIDGETNDAGSGPTQLTLEKTGGQWITDDANYTDLGCTIGTEIDVFNIGYGDLLGHIGVR